MKLRILMAAVALFFGSTAFAQQNDAAQAKEPPTAEQIAKIKADRMREELLLSKEQYDEVYKMVLKQTEKQMKRWEQATKEQKAFAEDMEGILNDAQFERFEQNRHRMKFGRRGDFGRGRFNKAPHKRPYCDRARKECKYMGQSPRFKGAKEKADDSISLGIPMEPIRPRPNVYIKDGQYM